MRQPTASDDKWAWYEAALRGDAPPVHEREPQCGFYRVRKWRWAEWTGAPWIPARIWLEPGETDPVTGELLTDETYRMEIDGWRVNPYTKWTWVASNPIPQKEWEWLTAMSPLRAKSVPKTR